jgi:capsular polysaccharide transport system permease protein
MRDEFQNETGLPEQTSARVATRPGPDEPDFIPVFSARPRVAVARLIRGPRPEDLANAPQSPPEEREVAQGPTSTAPDQHGEHDCRISPRPPASSTPPAPVTVAQCRQQVPTPTPLGTRPWSSSKRRRGLGFALFVLLPFCLVAFYMTAFASPQYSSTVAFAVRSTEGGGMSDALSGFARFAGTATSTDALILAEFLESQTLLDRLNGRLDLVRHYAAPFDRDPVFALSPAAAVEARLSHWRRMLEVRSDPSTGLLDLQVRAFSPEMAQLIARELLVESRILLNDLNAEARVGATAMAEAELATALDRLTAARSALTAFRTESRIVDPNSDYEGRTTVLRLLQGQLAQALVAEGVGDAGRNGAEAPHVVALRNRIDAERDRLVGDVGGQDTDYPGMLATHERLTADRDYAEAAYRTARTSLDLTLAQAARLDLYLAVYVQPTLAERADHARIARILGLSALFLGLIWAIGTVLRAAILDRR